MGLLGTALDGSRVSPGPRRFGLGSLLEPLRASVVALKAVEVLRRMVVLGSLEAVLWFSWGLPNLVLRTSLDVDAILRNSKQNHKISKDPKGFPDMV